MNTDLSNITALTMSSKEIAELTGKRHRDVLRDIDNIVNSLSAELRLGFKSSTYTDSTGKSNRMYKLDQDATQCLIAGYDANIRMRIIRRWRELEAKIVAPKTFAEALLLAYQQQKLIEEQDAKIKEDAPKVGFYDHIAPDESSMAIGQFAKALSDAHAIQIGPNKLFDYLRACGFLMKGRDVKEHNVPYAQWSMSGNGYFDITYNSTNVGTVPQTLITLAGQVALADQIVQYFSK